MIPEPKKPICVHESVTVSALASEMGVKASAVTLALRRNGIRGLSIDAQLDVSTATSVAATFGYSVLASPTELEIEQSVVSVARIRIERALSELDVAVDELLSTKEYEATGLELRRSVNGIRANILVLLTPATTCTDPASDGQMR